jgi:hypothetical protein
MRVYKVQAPGKIDPASVIASVNGLIEGEEGLDGGDILMVRVDNWSFPGGNDGHQVSSYLFRGEDEE